MEDVKLGHEDKLIVQLRQSLNRPTTTPDDICNILTTDIHEKERLKFQLEYMKAPSEIEIRYANAKESFIPRHLVKKYTPKIQA